MRKTHSLLFVTLILLMFTACSDPAANAPDAVVQDAAPPAAVTPEPMGETATYALSEDSTIDFVGSKVTGSHEGGFKDFEGTMTVIGDKPSKVQVTIDTHSLWSDNERLTGHLKSPDFFDVEANPSAAFESTTFHAADDGTYHVTGNLDLHGVTKQITFPAEVEITDSGFSAAAEFSIKRFDFGIEYAGKADDLIRDEVLIKLDLQSADAMADDTMGMDDDAEGTH